MRAEFDESLVTGNEMIDGQHKELIDKINKLLDSCETSKDKVVAVKTLDYLADYTAVSYTHLVPERSALWYYLSGCANAGIGNNKMCIRDRSCTIW